MPRRLVASLTAACGLALAPPAAIADPGSFYPGSPIDGPSADIVSLGDVDVARDGTGGLVYVKKVGGVDHVFASRLVDGAWQPPELISAGLAGNSSGPVVAAADRGRLTIAFISSGALFTVVRGEGQPFTPPALLASAASAPALDVSINNVAYVTYTAPGGGGADVRVARKERNVGTFVGLADPLDINPASPAGAGTGRSRVSVSADGTGVVVWGEAGHVYGRRVFDGRVSQAPQDLTLPTLAGFPGQAADLPDISMEDDSSFAWAIFRQGVADGAAGPGGRAVVRRLVGSQFEAPVVVDGMGNAASDRVDQPRIAVSGRGHGYSASATAGGTAVGAVLKDDVFNPGVILGYGVPGAAFPVPAVDESGDGVIAWQNADNTIHARTYVNVPASRAVQAPNGEAQISDPALGPSDALRGLDIASNRAGDVAIAFVQGVGPERRIVAGAFDRAPGRFVLNSRSTWRNVARTPLSWSASFELWGPITYIVDINRTQAGQTTATKLALAGLPDGVYRWRVVAVDRRGQAVATTQRTLRHDGTAPRVRFRVSRRGRVARVTATVTDAHPAGRRASGLHRVRIAFGDGSRAMTGRKATHRYRRPGKYRLRVIANDRAGNETVVERRITVR